MYDPATDVSPPTRYHESLARADALEREITDLCAQINAAGSRHKKPSAVAGSAS